MIRFSSCSLDNSVHLFIGACRQAGPIINHLVISTSGYMTWECHPDLVMASSATEVAADIEAESSPNSSLKPCLVYPRPRRKRNTSAWKNLPCFVGNGTSKEDENYRGSWSVLPVDIQDMILSKLSYQQLFQAKTLSKWLNDHINSDEFHGYRGAVHPQEGILTALHFYAMEPAVSWQCCGYDLSSNSWKTLPPFQILQDPKAEYLVCGAGGIMCVNISTHIIIFNPLTGWWRKLPPLHHPRRPVLMHMVIMDSSPGTYQIIVAGSGKRGQSNLSKITEVFDSRTSTWAIAQDMPGPLCGLNEHQVGVYRNGVLHCIAFLEGAGRGVLAFSVDEGTWLPHLACPLPNPTSVFNVMQLVDVNGEVVLFSLVEHLVPYSRFQERRIDILEVSGEGRGSSKWRNVVSEFGIHKWPYSECRCVPFGDGKVCIFNRDVMTPGIVYDEHSGQRVHTLSPPRGRAGMRTFLSMNPLTFTFKPSFRDNVQ